MPSGKLQNERFILFFSHSNTYLTDRFVISSCVSLLAYNQSWVGRKFHKFQLQLYHQVHLEWQRWTFSLFHLSWFSEPKEEKKERSHE